MTGEVAAGGQCAKTAPQFGRTAEDKRVDPAKRGADLPEDQKRKKDRKLHDADHDFCMFLLSDIELLGRESFTGQADSSPSKVH